MNSKIVKHVFIPLHNRLKGKDTAACLKKLDATQWFSKEDFAHYRTGRLADFLEHAFHSSSYYHNVFLKAGIGQADIKAYSVLKSLPLLDKDIIKNNLEKIRSRSYRGKIQLASTGGSTGEPVAIYWDMNRLSWDTAAQHRCYRWYGIDVGEKEAVLWGSPIEITKQDRIRNLRDHFINTKLLSAFNISEQSLRIYLDTLRKWNPSIIYCYSSVIYAFAKYLLGQGMSHDMTALKCICPTAEPLYDFQREVVEKAFGCSVSMEYGARDVGAIAHECPEGGLHINAENIILEILDASGNVSDEGTGEVIVTNVSTLGMPLIRYRTGDVATVSKEDCSCGRVLPVLKEVKGRTTDFLVGHDGRLIHALSAIYILREERDVKQFRVVQEKDKSITLSLVTYHKFSSDRERSVQNQFNNLLQGKSMVRFDYVDNIDPLGSGKHRYVISKITPELLKGP